MFDHEIRDLKEQLYQLQGMKSKADKNDIYWFIEHFSNKDISNRSSIYFEVCDDIILEINRDYRSDYKLAAIKSSINWGITQIETELNMSG